MHKKGAWTLDVWLDQEVYFVLGKNVLGPKNV